MGAIKFLEERKRMCETAKDCVDCPAHVDGECCMNNAMTYQTPETMVRIVEEWAFMNPAKMRQSEYLKLFPNAKLDNDGVLWLCPATAGGISVCTKSTNDIPETRTCWNCRKNFWATIIE